MWRWFGWIERLFDAFGRFFDELERQSPHFKSQAAYLYLNRVHQLIAYFTDSYFAASNLKIIHFLKYIQINHRMFPIYPVT
jgi:hypothetical protein